jgi:hypothetical protein
MVAKSRIKNLSTRFHWLYKNGSLLILIGLVSYFIYLAFRDVKAHGVIASFLPLSWIYIIWVWYWVNRRVYRTEFDDEFLYIIRKNQDTLIPLENIKDINLVSMGGVYRVDLYAKEEFGNTFYFKPSILYPFNHKKKEALVNLLWRNIEMAKNKKLEFQRNALHS